ncbi:N-acetylglucosamine-6-phosphate deacetylase [Actinomarinicola tropica]|uniref:Amidohydrolase family protein n=1 Tax=Actinomarinicola tropica TaxID=2789776 RepID=A0A5Q2RLK8_9ACTN|nr:amidohydrolase family protein [Actinomarinicola tropica]QGG95316.1 amidohydrolase family protein [Actinomarinicola tropica]
MTTIAASHVLWPDGSLAPGVVEVEGGRIVAVGRPTGEVPDRILAPGFVDLQVNGHGDVDVATADGADWDRLDRTLLAQGVTTWLPTLITDEPARRDAAAARVELARCRPGARPDLAGLHLEGPFLTRAGAHDPAALATPTAEALDALPPAAALVTLAPDVAGAVDAIQALRSRGVRVALGHSDATIEDARAAVAAGATLVTHVFNAMSPLHHRAPGLAGFALADDRVAVSVIADLAHVHPTVLRIVARCKPPGGLVLVTDAVAWGAGALGDREVRLVDGVPRLEDGTLAGSALTMDAAVRNLVDAGASDLASALYAASTAPARALGLDDRGTITVGARADLVALDHGVRVEAVWVGGEQAL